MWFTARKRLGTPALEFHNSFSCLIEKGTRLQSQDCHTIIMVKNKITFVEKCWKVFDNKYAYQFTNLVYLWSHCDSKFWIAFLDPSVIFTGTRHKSTVERTHQKRHKKEYKDKKTQSRKDSKTKGHKGKRMQTQKDTKTKWHKGK